MLRAGVMRMDLQGRRERSPGMGMAAAKESCREE